MREVPAAVAAALRIGNFGCWDTIDCDHDGLAIRIPARQPLGAGKIAEVVEISHPDASRPDILKAVGAVPGVSRVREVGVRNPNVTLAIVEKVLCGLCKALGTSPCVPLGMTRRSGTEFRLGVICPSRRACRELYRELQRKGLYVDVCSLGKKVVKWELTERQREILLAALDDGYFENPRKITLLGLARRFGVSKATIGETLRRALRGVLNGFV